MINIAGLDKAEVLAALYNASRPLGMGVLHFDPKPMTKEEAQSFLDGTGKTTEPSRSREPYFDYLKGRVMKVNLAGDEFEEWAYDRDNGPGAAARALAPLLASVSA